MAAEFLGKGWSFPVRLDRSGRIALSQYEELIRESILIILGTSKGERVMQPDFGCGIHDFTFTTLNSAHLALMEQSVREALTLWEPRIQLENVQMETKTLDQGMVLIQLEYLVRTTNNRYNLVYPFYLAEGAQ